MYNACVYWVEYLSCMWYSVEDTLTCKTKQPRAVIMTVVEIMKADIQLYMFYNVHVYSAMYQ